MRKVDVDIIIRMYMNGDSLDDIAKKAKVTSSGYVEAILENEKMLGKCLKRSGVVLDVAKARGLKKAGWSMWKIFDEFGGVFTVPEITAAIKDYCSHAERKEE